MEHPRPDASHDESPAEPDAARPADHECHCGSEPKPHDDGEREDPAVSELRERIASGDYRPDPEAIARRILERGDLEAAAGDEQPRSGHLRMVEPSEAENGEEGEDGATESGA